MKTEVPFYAKYIIYFANENKYTKKRVQRTGNPLRTRYKIKFVFLPENYRKLHQNRMIQIYRLNKLPKLKFAKSFYQFVSHLQIAFNKLLLIVFYAFDATS